MEQFRATEGELNTLNLKKYMESDAWVVLLFHYLKADDNIYIWKFSKKC